MVTIEDVLEEIVGEIVDESDHEEAEEFVRLDADSAEVLGSIHLNVINDLFGLELDESDLYDTLAGLVIAHAGRIPKAGETFDIERARVTVLEASRRHVQRLRIEDRGSLNAEDRDLPSTMP